MWEAFEDAELQSAQKRERRRRAWEAKEAAGTSARRASPHETLSVEKLMPPPRNIPRRVLKSSSTHRRNASMGADAEWSPLESHSGGDPTVSPLIVNPLTPYRDAEIRSPRSMTGARIPDQNL